MKLDHKRIKITLFGVFLVFLSVASLSGAGAFDVFSSAAETAQTPVAADDKYVGSETCAACHDEQFKRVSATRHGELHKTAAWKDKVTGCEACHGPGKDHVEAGGDKSKIISFKSMNAKAVSETCLACHSGKESHNNFRRGEHWRNNIGCTDCHAAHGPEPGKSNLGSGEVMTGSTRLRPTLASRAMLKTSEPQLCITCHNETKSQFTKPFHHKVLEGTMTCSDCHNAHGGFEAKQTKLSVGTDSACVKCHANKQGPFVFEHAPLKIEGCTACHTPHGSSNPKLLKRAQIRQLCLECHTGISEELSPQAPSLHNQAAVRYQQCTVCHSAIHGSNSSNRLFR